MAHSIRIINNELLDTHGITVTKKALLHDCSVHCHGFYELEIITDGSSEAVINGRRFELLPRTVTLLSPKDIHEFKHCKGLTMYNVQFRTDVPDEKELLIPTSAYPICSVDDKTYEKLCTMLELTKDLAKGNTGERRCAARLLEAALTLLRPFFGDSSETDRTNEPMCKAVSYINAHFKENPSLDTLARITYFDKRYFCTAFKKHTGMSYKKYLREIKLRYASRLITYTDMPVIRIAAESGYTSVSHFNREFFAFFGETPTNMRKKSRG